MPIFKLAKVLLILSYTILSQRKEFMFEFHLPGIALTISGTSLIPSYTLKSTSHFHLLLLYDHPIFKALPKDTLANIL